MTRQFYWCHGCPGMPHIHPRLILGRPSNPGSPEHAHSGSGGVRRCRSRQWGIRSMTTPLLGMERTVIESTHMADLRRAKVIADLPGSSETALPTHALRTSVQARSLHVPAAPRGGRMAQLCLYPPSSVGMHVLGTICGRNELLTATAFLSLPTPGSKTRRSGMSIKFL